LQLRACWIFEVSGRFFITFFQDKKVMKKAIPAVLICVTLYYGFDFLRIARLSSLFFECTTATDREVFANDHLSQDEKLKVSNRVFSCAKEKQTFVDRFFKVVPDAWTQLPRN